MCLSGFSAADVLAQALDSLHTELMSEESRGLFIYYGGVCVLLWMLRAGRGGLHTLIDILMQLTEQSRKYMAVVSSRSPEYIYETAVRSNSFYILHVFTGRIHIIYIELYVQLNFFLLFEWILYNNDIIIMTHDIHDTLFSHT